MSLLHLSSYNHYKALKIIYNSNESYNELLICSNGVSFDQKHFRALPTEIHKILININPDFMKPYFVIQKIPHNLRIRYALKSPSENSR